MNVPLLCICHHSRFLSYLTRTYWHFLSVKNARVLTEIHTRAFWEHFTHQDNQSVSLLTIDIHDADAHYAGDNNQREASSVVVHQQQPIDSSLQTENREWVETASPREKTTLNVRSTCVWDLPVLLVARPVRIQQWPLTAWPQSCSWWSSLCRSRRRWPSPGSPAGRTTRTGVKGFRIWLYERWNWTAVAQILSQSLDTWLKMFFFVIY